jgi:hypothetical protein
MAVLAYCITESARPIEVPAAGVAGLAVASIEHSGLRCFVSRSPSSDTVFGAPAREAALAFHRVLQAIFRQAAIIPFRFPTLLADEAEMTGHLHEHAAAYQEALARLRDRVQMEIHLGVQGSAQNVQATGTEYLRSRQVQESVLEGTAGKLQQAGQRWISNWRQQTSAQHIRCYALVSRGSVAELERALVSVEVPSSVSVRVSGPWPATEFIKEE